MCTEENKTATNDEIATQEDKTTAEAQETTEATDKTELSEADKLAAAEAEIASLKDKYLRQVAEFDNYRKRTLKEKTELILNGGEKVLSTLLPVLDDLDRAAINIEQSDNIETLKEGVTLILDKLSKTLATQGLQKMETAGKEFDTDFHEAIAMIPAQDEAQKNHIVDCVQPGYMLHEKVLRHAKVVVGQ